MGSIQKLPREIVGYVFESVVLCGSPENISVEGVKLAFSLTQVNHYFYSVAVNTPSLWSTVSNKQPIPVFKRCMERSKKHSLSVAILIGETLEKWFREFSIVIVSHAPRWREFYLWVTEYRDFFLLQYHQLRPINCGLHLPQLRELTLIYPMPDHLGRIDHVPPVREMINRYNPASAGIHFYKNWTTPNLHSVSTTNIFPYHTQGSEIRSCRVKLPGNTDRIWSCKPILSMYPNWSKLRHLAIQLGNEETRDSDGQTVMGVTATALPNLETLSASFRAIEMKNFNHPILNLLEFTNVAKISILVIIDDLTDDDSDEPAEVDPEFIRSNVCCPLQERSQFPNLSYIELGYRIADHGDLKILFDRHDTIPSAKLVVSQLKYIEEEVEDAEDPDDGLDEDPDEDHEDIEQPAQIFWGDETKLIDASNALSVVCVEKLYPVIQRQPGWQDLHKMWVVAKSDDQFAFLQGAFHDWEVQRQPVSV